jgi:hypothetical protein
MTEFKKAVITGFLLGASLGLIANYAHASTAAASHGHHGGGNNGALGAAAGAFGGSKGSAAGAGQSGQGGSYGTWYLKSSLVDGYQPWPEEEMRQFQKP